MKKLFSRFSTAQILLLSFLLVIVVGTVLLLLPFATYNPISLIDAIFTSTSATCVTGLMTLCVTDDFTIFGQVVILILIQVGGLGLMSFVTLMMNLVSNGLSLSERMFIKDSLNKDNSKNIKQYLFIIFKYTFVIEIVGFILLLTQVYDGSNYSIFQSLFLSISAFCNAGIDLFGSSSLIPFQTNLIVNLVVCALIILGGLGFMVLMDIKENLNSFFNIRKKEPIKLKVHTKIVLNVTLLLIISGLILIFGFEYTNALKPFSFFEKIEVSLFNSVTLRTAGFSTFDYSILRTPTKIIMLIFMLIGASPGGTGGGMKTTTLFLLVYCVYTQYKRQEHMVIYKHHVHKTNFIKATSIFSIYIVFILLGIIGLTSFEGINSLDLLFEVVSAIGTVGLSVGITGMLSMAAKVIIIVLMFVGRIGPITIAIVFGNKKNETGIKYPSTDIVVG